jgi:transcriptional regulator GlxA family with amidase domain
MSSSCPVALSTRIGCDPYSADSSGGSGDAPQARHDRVVAAAAEVLSAGGEEAVQLQDLAQRAKVSQATLYRYFPSKDYVWPAPRFSDSRPS